MFDCCRCDRELHDDIYVVCEDCLADIEANAAKLKSSRDEAVKLLRLTTAWMRWWLSENDCGCDAEHTCGYEAREAVCLQAELLLARFGEEQRK